MILSYQKEIQNLENKIQELKSEENIKRRKFEPVLERFSDAQIDFQELRFDFNKVNQLHEVYSLYNYKTELFAFSKSATCLMTDFFLSQETEHNYHNNYDTEHFYLFPFYKLDGFIIFPDFKMIEIHEFDWFSAKRNKSDLEKLIAKLKEKNLSRELIEKFLLAGGFKEQEKKEDLNNLLDIYYSSLE